MANHLSIAERDALHFRVLDVLTRHPEFSQRELARELGLSLGRLNYCLKGLVDQGMVRVERFASSPHKRGYWIVLTPAGLARRMALARDYLARRRLQFDALRTELEALQRDWPGLDNAP